MLEGLGGKANRSYMPAMEGEGGGRGWVSLTDMSRGLLLFPPSIKYSSLPVCEFVRTPLGFSEGPGGGRGETE